MCRDRLLIWLFWMENGWVRLKKVICFVGMVWVWLLILQVKELLRQMVIRMLLMFDWVMVWWLCMKWVLVFVVCDSSILGRKVIEVCVKKGRLLCWCVRLNIGWIRILNLLKLFGVLVGSLIFWCWMVGFGGGWVMCVDFVSVLVGYILCFDCLMWNFMQCWCEFCCGMLLFWCEFVCVVLK